MAITKGKRMSTLRENYSDFEACASNGIDCCHSGCDFITVYNVQDWYDNDEVDCENCFSNSFCDLDVSVESILIGEINVDEFEIEECHNSFINGQFKQFEDQFNQLEDHDEFLDYAENYGFYVPILRRIIGFNY
jgi:hypothetical protein